jgi:TfoX/Sxy family transcriptional regulator of competence genes
MTVMSNKPDLIRFIEDQLGDLDIRTRLMFGECVIYCDEKVVGFICDDTLFITPSAADSALFERTVPAPPYPGAKDYRSVPSDALEDRHWLQQAVQATADALPVPSPKKPRAKQTPTKQTPTKQTPTKQMRSPVRRDHPPRSPGMSP